MTRIETVVLDMAGTTVTDDGVVLNAFERAWDRLRADEGAQRREEAIEHVIATMGQSKIEVFRGLGDEDSAQALNTAFEEAAAALVGDGAVAAIPGAEDAVRALRAEGRAVVLTTGFARPTADAVLRVLGWEDLADAVLTPADAGRGRPAPDLNLVAVLRTGASSVSALAVVGDTESDARGGVNAGAGLVAAVLTGQHASEQALRAAGAQHVLSSVAELPGLLAQLGR
ncbi:HAD family hydrolase [Microbacterium sp. No. 7]|uniref:HAD family hydrolase n=1 Tax=Microbacterium sp. No. 7 TaxID=1714373 RepID=UPI0006D1CEC3|nr:HAD family hydrolase [Microbacterium sp. No. 7]ALJ21970.1 haloacid dehalogenase [Microbacterium sp. No. 7]